MGTHPKWVHTPEQCGQRLTSARRLDPMGGEYAMLHTQHYEPLWVLDSILV